MYKTVSYGPVNQEDNGRNVRLFCSRVCAKAINVIPIVGYFVLLSWRFVGLILYGKYTIYSSCYVWRDEFGTDPTVLPPAEKIWVPVELVAQRCGHNDYSGFLSMSCYDFTPYCFPTKQTAAWLIGCIVNTLFVILVLAKVPGYDGHLPTLRKNAKEARFWTFLLQLLLSIAYKVYLILIIRANRSKSSSLYFVTLFILEEILTTIAVYFWNGVPAPWKNPRVPAKLMAYKLTLVVFLLEKFYLFLLSLFFTTATAGKNRIFSYDRADLLLATMITAADASFLYSLTKFFWNKLFYGEKNLLINDNV